MMGGVIGCIGGKSDVGWIENCDQVEHELNKVLDSRVGPQRPFALLSVLRECSKFRQGALLCRGCDKPNGVYCLYRRLVTHKR